MSVPEVIRFEAIDLTFTAGSIHADLLLSLNMRRQRVEPAVCPIARISNRRITAHAYLQNACSVANGPVPPSCSVAIKPHPSRDRLSHRKQSPLAHTDGPDPVKPGPRDRSNDRPMVMSMTG